MRKLESKRYYTTPLAIRLLSCAAHAEAGPSQVRVRVRLDPNPIPNPNPNPNPSPNQAGFLVLETNFRLYSYTDSPLWVEPLVGGAARPAPQLAAPASVLWPPGAGSQGSRPRCALGTSSCCAAQGPREGLRCGRDGPGRSRRSR